MTGSAPDWSLLDRPMGPRSIIASLLLGMHPPRLGSNRIVRWCGLFGVSENAVRVALSRMTERGELVASAGTYELTGRVLARQAGQDWALAPALRDWQGRWVLRLVTGERRSAAQRATFRHAASSLRLAELREGVWGRPDNLPAAADPEPAGSIVRSQTTRWYGRPDAEVGAELDGWFGVSGWAQRAEALVRELSAATAALPDRAAVAPAFVAGAAALQHLRRDPLLPPELLPSSWPGPALRSCYLAYQPRFSSAAAAVLGS